MPDRPHAQHVITLVAFLALFIVLCLPSRLAWISPSAFVFLPLEFMVICALLMLPGLAGTISRVLLALLLGLAMLLRGSDLVTHELFARPFSPVLDLHLLADGSRLLSGVLGAAGAILVAILLVGACLFGCWLAFAILGRVQRALRTSPRTARVSLALLVVTWGVLKSVGVPRAGTFTYDQLVLHAVETVESIRDISAFADTVGEDTYAESGGDDLLSGLRGKDVLIIFAESYGRVLLDRAPFADPVSATLREAEAELAAAGLQSRSAFLRSPTVGGLSWLAHATALSGAWIDRETRYESLIKSERVTLNRIFRKAGWRTVAAMPAISMAWPEGAYFGYDHIYNAHNSGYAGLPFNWVTMPDQYVLSAVHEQERERDQGPPLMAEIALISSHAPWTPIARLVPWEAVGDGRIFNEQARSGPSPLTVWQDIDTVRSHYRQSIEYTIRTVVSYARRYGDDDLVILVLGDHPPAPLVSGDGDSDQVPVHLIARDPDIIEAIGEWGWHPGLLPGPDAPVWRMDRLRDRFVTAFSSGQGKED